MTNVTDAEFTETTALAVAEPVAPPATLFGTDDPVEVIAKATRIADALVAVVEKKGLIANIKGKKYPQVEAWQTMAAMMSITAVCEWSRPVADGWEARVVLYNRQRDIIGSAEAQCIKNESGKRSWEDYALRSMAQTRATSKAYRSNLGFVMVLAGYQATPAEEMPVDAAQPEPKYTHEERIKLANRQLFDKAKTAGVCFDAESFLQFVRDDVGIEGAVAGWKPTDAEREAVHRILDHIAEQVADRS